MDSGQEFNQRLDEALQPFRAEAKQIIGRRIVIKSNYNGQPYGRSKPSLKYSTQIIADAAVVNDGLFISIEGYRFGSPMLSADEWEFTE